MKNGVRRDTEGFSTVLGHPGPPMPAGSNPPGTLQISTLLAASSISSLRASALAPEGCRLLAKPEDLADCCHLRGGQSCHSEGQGPNRALDRSHTAKLTTVPSAQHHADGPTQTGRQHLLPTPNIPSPNQLQALGSPYTIIFRRTHLIQMGGERKAMGEPGRDTGDYRHFPDLSPEPASSMSRQNPKSSPCLGYRTTPRVIPAPPQWYPAVERAPDSALCKNSPR